MVLLRAKTGRTPVRVAQIQKKWHAHGSTSPAKSIGKSKAKKFEQAIQTVEDCDSSCESISSSATSLYSSGSTTSFATTESQDANQFLKWAKSILAIPQDKTVQIAMDQQEIENALDFSPVLSYSERCPECHQSLVLVEHSGVLKCVTTRCVANGRRINVVDGDMSCLPFGADISYKSMSLARDDQQLCEADRDVVYGEKNCETLAPLPSNTSLFNSLLKGCPASSSGVRCNTVDNPLRHASDGSCTLSCNDAHFRHLCTVFGYSPTNKSAAKSVAVNNPYTECIGPSMVMYVQTCLCKTICGTVDPHHSESQCLWRNGRDGSSINYTAVSHVVARIVKDSSDQEWKKLNKQPSFIANLLAHLLGRPPVAPSDVELSQACQYFVVARRAKDEEFLNLAQTKSKPFKAGFVWSKIWQMMKPESHTQHFFPLPSNVARLKSLDDWWKRLCATYGWQYYPTPMPLIASKMSVRLCTAEQYHQMTD